LVPEDRLADQHLLDERPRLGAADLGSECEHIVATAQHHRAVHRREPADRVDRLPEAGIARTLAHQIAEFRERRRHGVGNRHDRFAPGIGAVRHHEQRAAVLVRPHRQRERQEHVFRVRGRLIEPEQRLDEVGALGGDRALDVHDFHLIPFEYRDIRELAVRIRAPVFDDQQAWLDHFDHKAERRDRPRRAPDAQFVANGPDAEVNAGPLDGG